MKRDITVRMDKLETEIEDRFTNLYCKKDFEYRLKAAKEATYDQSLRIRHLNRLAEMFNDVNIPCLMGQSISYYEKLFPLLTVVENTNGVNKSLIKEITSFHSLFPTPEEFIERTVNSLESETILDGTLELRILRRFLRFVNVKENKKYFSKFLQGKVDSDGIESVDNRVFDVINSKSIKCDYLPIVQGCYNLAKGRFVSPIATKELLFLFAFAFDMRYYFSIQDEGYDIRRDVEKNLFVDYYSDNLTRYITSNNGGDDGISDSEPSGTVLNPKNFVDVLFVYYLNSTGLTSQEKVAKFYRTIETIKKKWTEREDYHFENDGLNRFNESAMTKKYDTMLQSIQSIDENNIADYIINNYYCDFGYLYHVKKDEYYEDPDKEGRYIRVDTDVEADMIIEDCICIRNLDGKETIIAIETIDCLEQGKHVLMNQLRRELVGANYFVYDEEKKAYLTKTDFEFPYVPSKEAKGRYDLAGFEGSISISDHICISEVAQQDTIVSIETPVKGTPYIPVTEDQIKKKKISGSKYFIYDKNSHAYVRKRSSFRKVVSKETEKQYLGTFELGFYKKTSFEQYLMVLDLVKDALQLPFQFSFRDNFALLDGRSLLNDNLSPDDDDYYDKDYEIEVRQYQENSNAMSLLSLYENIPELEGNIPTDFLNLFEQFSKKLDPKEVLCITDPLKLTRTKLIAAYYHYYVCENTQRRDSSIWQSFKDVYEDFSNFADQYIVDAGYQPISTKNIFDILVIFSAYCKINDYLS